MAIAWLVAVLTPAAALAAAPSPSAPVAGDTRSAGEGPGLVGAPLLAILVVIALGVVTALVTLAYVRLSRAAEDDTPQG
jgi:hypothetical protein